MDSGCRCCRYWSGVVRSIWDVAGEALETARKTAAAAAAAASTADCKGAEGDLRARVKSLEEDNKRHAETNRKLSARANGISVSSSSKKKKKKTDSGKAGRPRGKRPRSTGGQIR